MSEELAGPASSAEVGQPSQEVVAEHSPTISEGTGASEQAAEQTDEQRRASEAGRELASRRKASLQAARFRQEFDDLKRERSELTRALIQATQGQRQPEQAKPATGPSREQFDSYEAWNDARAEWKAEQKAEQVLKDRLENMSRQAQEQQYRQQAEQIEQAHGQRVAEFAEQSPDFQDLLAERGEHIRLPDDVAYTVMMAPDGPQIMHAMLQYPKLAEEFWKVPPAMRSMVLGKVSAALQNRPPQVSKAPPPGKPVGSGGSSGLTGMSADAYYESITKHHRKGKT